MQPTSALYKELLSGNHWKECKVLINGTEYSESSIVSIKTSNIVFNQNTPTVGGALSSEIAISLRLPSTAIPRMAELRPCFRLTDGVRSSEWLPKGVFYVDTRTENHEKTITNLSGFDRMLKADEDYPSSSLVWPATDIQVVQEIASTIGVSVDARTWDVMVSNYSVSLPAMYTMRETLGYIAAMYCGNFIISDTGKLLLLPLNALPEESYYLVNKVGDFITFGGDRIIVR